MNGAGSGSGLSLKKNYKKIPKEGKRFGKGNL